jgi:hypothetical protein
VDLRSESAVVCHPSSLRYESASILYGFYATMSIIKSYLVEWDGPTG